MKWTDFIDEIETNLDADLNTTISYKILDSQGETDVVQIQSESIKEKLDLIIGKNIRKIRKSHEMSSSELAQLLGTSSCYLWVIERGKRGVSSVILSKLSLIFNVRIDTFFEPLPILHENRQSNEKLAMNRKKISSLMANLADTDIEFIAYVIQGVIATRHLKRE